MSSPSIHPPPGRFPAQDAAAESAGSADLGNSGNSAGTTTPAAPPQERTWLGPPPWPGMAWVGAEPHQLWKGAVRKKIAPHQPGAGRWSERFGLHLVCVRYRDDPQNQRRVVTVELLVDERPLRPRPARPMTVPKPSPPPASVRPPVLPPPVEWVGIRIAWGQDDLARRARTAGGVWNRKLQLWVMTRAQAHQAGLEDRITEANLGPDPFALRSQRAAPSQTP